MPVPPPPQGLPPPERRIRFLKGTPKYIAAGIVICMAGFAYYGLGLLGSSSKHSKDEGSSVPVNGSDDILKRAPTGNEVRAAFQVLPGKDTKTPGDTKYVYLKPVEPPVDEDMTPMAIAARSERWKTHYKEIQTLHDERFAARKAAMNADIGGSGPSSPGGGNEMPSLGGLGGGGPGLGGLANLGSSLGASAGGLGAGLANGLGGGGGGLAGAPVNSNGVKSQDFFAASRHRPQDDYLPYGLTNPQSQYQINAGDVMTGKMFSEINSDTRGHMIAYLTKPVLGGPVGTDILIPAYSRLFGTYDTSQSYGQSRIVVAWQQITYPEPCKQQLDLGAWGGADQAGAAGFEDLTDNHLGKVFFNAMLVSLFAAGIQLSQPPGSALQQYNPVQTAGGAIGQQMATLGQQFAERGLNIPPTQVIRQGYPFTIIAEKNIPFEHPWHEGICNDMELASNVN